MRIGIDVRSLAEEKRSGVEEYTFNLLKNIFRQDKQNTYILFYSSFKEKIPQTVKSLQKYPNVRLKRYRIPNKLLNLLLWYFQRPYLDKLLEVELFYTPNLIFTSVSPQCRHFITVHDLSFERFPEFFNFYRRLWHWLINPRRLVNSADKVITVSDSTKKDIEKLYHFSSDKIIRIYPGISKNFFKEDKQDRFREVRKRYSLPAKYILSLATLEPRKNIESLIIAYNYLRVEKKIDHKLVIAGSAGWLYQSLYRLIKASPFSKDICLIGEVDENDRKYVFKNSSLFVFPSFYEGFGFPPLEALACKVPLLCSCVSSLPEVVGESAIFVDPYNRNEIAFAIKAILRDDKLRKTLSKRGFKQSKMFSWSKTAKEFINLY